MSETYFLSFKSVYLEGGGVFALLKFPIEKVFAVILQWKVRYSSNSISRTYKSLDVINQIKCILLLNFISEISSCFEDGT